MSSKTANTSVSENESPLVDSLIKHQIHWYRKALNSAQNLMSFHMNSDQQFHYLLAANYLAPPIKALRLAQVHLYILSEA